MPAPAWQAVQSAAVGSSSRPLPFDELPAGAEETAVLSVWLTAVLDGDPGTEADREAMLRADRDVFDGEAKAARALVRFMRESDGFRVEEVRPAAVPEPSAN